MSALRWFCSAAALLAALPSLAQYKVVGPDGRITYTDRPPADAAAKVTNLGRRDGLAAAPAVATGLPADLQRVADRFPVTLFTSAPCAPCDSGRQLLQQRGVPYSERVIANGDDIAALERTVGGRTLPSLTVGGQALRGFNPSDWASYLDAAGYPRESRLPRGWAAPAPTPLVARAPAPQAATPTPAPEPAPLPPAEPETTPDGGTGIRF